MSGYEYLDNEKVIYKISCEYKISSHKTDNEWVVSG